MSASWSTTRSSSTGELVRHQLFWRRCQSCHSRFGGLKPLARLQQARWCHKSNGAIGRAVVSGKGGGVRSCNAKYFPLGCDAKMTIDQFDLRSGLPAMRY